MAVDLAGVLEEAAVSLLVAALHRPLLQGEDLVRAALHRHLQRHRVCQELKPGPRLAQRAAQLVGRQRRRWLQWRNIQHTHRDRERLRRLHIRVHTMARLLQRLLQAHRQERADHHTRQAEEARAQVLVSDRQSTFLRGNNNPTHRK